MKILLISISFIAFFSCKTITVLDYEYKNNYIESKGFLFNCKTYSKTKLDSIYIGNVKFEEEYFYIKSKLNFNTQQIDGFVGPAYSGVIKKRKLKVSFIPNPLLLKADEFIKSYKGEVRRFKLNEDTLQLIEVSPFEFVAFVPYIEDSEISNYIIKVEIMNKHTKLELIEPPIRSYYRNIKIIGYGNIFSFYNRIR